MASLEIENGSSITEGIPTEEEFYQWYAAALPPEQQEAEACLRIMDSAEIQLLNRTYRHKDSPTNVLSFPCELPDGVDSPLLGDLAISVQVIKKEAAEQNKEERAHWAHMLVHGTLHLLGYDHIEDNDAAEMEQLEIKILANLGFANPYL